MYKSEEQNLRRLHEDNPLSFLICNFLSHTFHPASSRGLLCAPWLKKLDGQNIHATPLHYTAVVSTLQVRVVGVGVAIITMSTANLQFVASFASFNRKLTDNSLEHLTPKAQGCRGAARYGAAWVSTAGQIERWFRQVDDNQHHPGASGTKHRAGEQYVAVWENIGADCVYTKYLAMLCIRRR